jgi:hypothetical protein
VPVAEGVYSLIHTKNTTHFAYMITVPSDIGQVQENFGIHDKGSFVVSVRNPSFESPPYARLPESASYPKSLLEEFQDLRWLPLHPKFMDYKYCEILFIGEKQDTFPDADTKDDANLKEAEEELEGLEENDEQRVQHLKEDHAVFGDLRMKKEEYSKLRTEW